MGVAFPDTSRVAYNRPMAIRRINDPIELMTLGNMRANGWQPSGAVWNDFSYSRVVRIWFAGGPCTRMRALVTLHGERPHAVLAHVGEVHWLDRIGEAGGGQLA
jgi:hypothetical protein